MQDSVFMYYEYFILCVHINTENSYSKNMLTNLFIIQSINFRTKC